MENKYYTPEIEEFHVGFECELKNSSHPINFEWEHFKIIGVDDAEISGRIMDWSFYDTNIAIKEKTIRVKYLDREDIEELGWENRSVINIWSENDEIIDGFSLSAGDTDTYVLLYDESTNVLGIYLQRIYNEASGNWSEYIMFSGTIKNKSELKKLMVQLGIK